METEQMADSVWAIPYLALKHFQPAYKITDDLIHQGNQQISCGHNWKLQKLDELVSLDIPPFTLLKHLDLDQKNKYIAVIVNLKLIFNIQLENAYSELKLDYLDRITEKQVLQLFLAYTKRGYFHHSFNKHTLLPKVKQKDTKDYFYFIVEHDPNSEGYFQIRIFNEYLYCCGIQSYLCLATIQKNIALTFFRRYKKQKTIYVLFNGQSNPAVHAGIIQFFIQHYKDIMFVHWVNPNTLTNSESRTFGKILLQSDVQLYADIAPQRYVLATAPFSEDNLALLQQINKCYNQINSKIFQQPINPCLRSNLFFFNSFCTKIYGSFYNYLRNKIPNFARNEHLKFTQTILGLCSTRKRTREIGHYAVKIKDKGAEQGEDGAKKYRQKSLLCCVCTKIKNERKKEAEEKKEMQQEEIQCHKKQDFNPRKSRYQCEKCSIICSRPIVICLPHFLEYHKNKQHYNPKGVRARYQELMETKQNKTSDSNTNPNTSSDVVKQAEQILQNIRSEVIRNMPIIDGLNKYLNQANTKSQPFYPLFPQSFMFIDPIIPTDNQFRDISIKRQNKNQVGSVKQEKMMPQLKEQIEMQDLNQQEDSSMSEEGLQNLEQDIQSHQENPNRQNHEIDEQKMDEQEMDEANMSNHL